MQATIRVREEALAVVRSGLQMKRNALEHNLRQYQERALGFEQQHGMTSSRFTERFSRGELGDESDWFEWDVEAHPAVTLLEVLDEVVAHLAV